MRWFRRQTAFEGGWGEEWGGVAGKQTLCSGVLGAARVQGEGSTEFEGGGWRDVGFGLGGGESAAGIKRTVWRRILATTTSNSEAAGGGPSIKTPRLQRGAGLGYMFYWTGRANQGHAGMQWLHACLKLV